MGGGGVFGGITGISYDGEARPDILEGAPEVTFQPSLTRMVSRGKMVP
jgi:hypothetical protein